MKKRFIFDLDGTLLHMSYAKEEEYFKRVLTREEQDMFFQKYMGALIQYENIFDRYDINDLSKFLIEKTSVNITVNMIEDWIKINGDPDDILLPETISMLEYLKSKGYSLAVLTNWFLETQKMRLQNAGILKYFDDIYMQVSYIQNLQKKVLYKHQVIII